MQIIYAWACDFSPTTGEGNLSRNYLKKFLEIKKNTTILVKTPFDDYKVKKNKISLIKQRKKDKQISFFHRFIYPFQGLIYLIYLNLCNKRTMYLNYLPLWNSILIMFLPKNCLFGPITGSIYIDEINYFSSFLRKYILPFFYKLSSKIIKYKEKNIIFATDILTKYLKNLNYENYIENFTNSHFVKKYTKTKKNIDFLIYYRIHLNKGNDFHRYIINKLKKKYKVYVFGDKLEIKGIYNLGFLSNKMVHKYLSKSKYTILSKENIMSLFALEARTNNLLIFFNKKLKSKNSLEDNFIPLSYKKNFNTYNYIIKKINLKKNFFYRRKNFIHNLEFKKKIKLTNLYFDFLC